MLGAVLSIEDRAYFLALMRRQSNSAVHRRMNALLLLDDGWSAERVAEALFIEAETVRAAQVVGIAVSMIGALILVAQGDVAVLAGLDFNRGDLWMMAGIVSYSFYTALLRWRPPVHGMSFAAVSFVIGAVLLLPFHVAESLAGQPLPLTGTAAMAIFYVAVFASVLAYLSFNRAVALVGANMAGMSVHLVPAFGMLLAILLLGEVPRAYHAAGIALIAVGIWLAQRRPGK